jgi:DNA-binding NarL/FixJ family response regulator
LSATRNSERSGTKRALLVDDHDLFREVLGVVLERRAGLGGSVHAGSPAEARRALGDHKEGRVSCRFDLAVVNLDLPGGGGLELLEELRQAAPEVPVLGITANGDHDLRAQALGAGADEVLVLSASGEEVIAAARRLGGGGVPC